MKSFDTYLYEQAYARSTINTYLIYHDKFIKWCESKGYDPKTIDYKSCLAYAKKLQRSKKGKIPSKKSTTLRICALKAFFKYLIEENHRGDNPMENMNIRGVKRSLNHNLLEYEELEDLFYSFPTQNIELPSSPSVAIRDKVITGLMVYQGLSITSIKHLKIEHINLERGNIYVPSTRKTNYRKLEIKSPQVLSLAQYIQTDREVLQNAIACHTEAFIPQNSDRFTVACQLFKKLRRINLNIKNAHQIRASVITHWLKLYNIREVQYMAGHRYISSTERFLQDDIENLQEMIDNLHPIN